MSELSLQGEFTPPQELVERFQSSVDKNGPDGCWLWLGAQHVRGYGHFYIDGRLWMAHRFAVRLAGVDIPDGYEVDHLCRNPPCVNPEHLEPVTKKVNALRGYGVPAINARKTHCKRGHEFTPENTIPRPGGRECRACSLIHRANSIARQRVARRQGVA